MTDVSPVLKLALHPAFYPHVVKILADENLLQNPTTYYGWPSFMIMVCEQPELKTWLDTHATLDGAQLFELLPEGIVESVINIMWNSNSHMLTLIPIVSIPEPQTDGN